MQQKIHVNITREDRALQDVQNEFVESRRERTRLQEELLRKEKALRDTEIRSVHEMGRMKRAQEQQVEELSVQKVRESHESIQQLTSPNCSKCKNR